jgi:tetratricopeptide (TPR) repeat protein
MAVVQFSELARGIILLALAVVAVGWIIVRSVKNAENRGTMVFNWLLTAGLAAVIYFAVPLFGIFGLFLIVLSAVILSAIWTPHLGEIFAGPITGLFDGGHVPPEPRPAYSVAQGKQKRGQYLEAIADIRKQLERFPNDFEGHLLLAQIQAENLNDLPAAELTIQQLCAQPGHAPSNITFALYSLADWHIKALDRDAARRAFEQVIRLLPDTEFALVAAQRIAHLANPDMPLNPHDQKFVVPEGIRHLGLLQRMEIPKLEEKTPGQQAADYVQHLRTHPLDTEAREHLAVIYADHYHRLDLAADQLEQMIQQPNQPHRLVARWLNLLADLQIRCGAGYDVVKQTLERIIALAPNLAPAENARKRIALLRLELKALEKSESVELGSYEQNIGLKQGRGASERGASERGA